MCFSDSSMLSTRIRRFSSRNNAISLLRCFSSPSGAELRRLIAVPHERNNIGVTVASKVGVSLHLNKSSPLCIIKEKIEACCNEIAAERGESSFKAFDNLSPIVTTKQCFDDLRVPPDHVSRSPSDTYYLNDRELLRAHTSAHQCMLMGQGETAFLCSGDVYRRDEIDSSHYPVFHQMEGVRLYPDGVFPDDMSEDDRKTIIAQDLKDTLSKLARKLFGDVEMRWADDYFPFTTPSYELEVKYNGDWLEVLGCGVIHDDVISNAGLPEGKLGWAFGLGLERLAMVLFGIPDIRLFWSQDPRFLEQFQPGQICSFKPYSKYPECSKDISFWLPEQVRGDDGASYHANDLHELIRQEAGDIVEKVSLFDEFTHPKSGRRSEAWRITYRHMDRSLTNEEVDAIQERVRKQLASKLRVELR